MSDPTTDELIKAMMAMALSDADVEALIAGQGVHVGAMVGVIDGKLVAEPIKAEDFYNSEPPTLPISPDSGTE